MSVTFLRHFGGGGEHCGEEQTCGYFMQDGATVDIVTYSANF
jgi:hypothetical protein